MENSGETNTSNTSGSGSSAPGGCPCKFDWQFVAAKLKDVVTDPKGCWERIRQENLSIQDIYLRFLVWTAALYAIGFFVGQSIVGYTVPVIGTIRAPFFGGLVSAIVLALLLLLGMYITALVFETLAPKFGGTISLIDSFRVSSHSSAIVLAAGIFQIIPPLWLLVSLIVGLYAVYVSYLGIKALANIPDDKRILYYIVSLLGSTACMIIIVSVVNFIVPIYRW